MVSENSLFFEKLLEYKFVSEITTYGWYSHRKEVKVLRPEVDSSGYDIVLNCNNVNRYIQLKTSDKASKTSKQNLNILLLNEENPCIIWIRYCYNKIARLLELEYNFWGEDVGQKVEIPSRIYKTGKKAKRKPRAKAIKKEKLNIKQLSKGAFQEIKIETLFCKLFNIKK
jgi:hypothetical protein